MFNEPGPAGRQSGKPEIKRGKTIERIRAALEKDTRINLHHYPITLAFAGDDLVLTGELEDIAAKKIALELALAIAPSTGIVDRLRVEPAQTMSDAELRDHGIKALLDEPALEHCLLHSRLANQLQTHRDGILSPSAPSWSKFVMVWSRSTARYQASPTSASPACSFGGFRDVVTSSMDWRRCPPRKTTTTSLPTRYVWLWKKILSSMPPIRASPAKMGLSH